MGCYLAAVSCAGGSALCRVRLGFAVLSAEIDFLHSGSFPEVGGEVPQCVPAFLKFYPMGNVLLNLLKGSDHSRFDLSDLKNVIGVLVGDDGADLLEPHREHD